MLKSQIVVYLRVEPMVSKISFKEGYSLDNGGTTAGHICVIVGFYVAG